eukprot:TRINITY_DN50090_c0_g1_i1.p1 TRINITY_DN50090_c0_g1~~TRINITY_DN50090_c0_g1_i1.p1  ORF type:complete len:228 (+),score=30.66 TRINITY_DN50090_c0_g1_i1:46-729(+)
MMFAASCGRPVLYAFRVLGARGRPCVTGHPVMRWSNGGISFAAARQFSSTVKGNDKESDSYRLQDTKPEKPKSLNYGLEHPLTQTYMKALKMSRTSPPRSNNSPAVLAEFQKALDMALADGGTTCLEHATILLDMAKEHAKMGNPSLAAEVASQGLPVFEQYWGKDHRVYAEAAFDVACFYALQKKTKESLEIMYDCRGSFLKHYGPDHPKTGQCLQMIHALERQKA